jgi:uncharacterized protein (TIRG00374 family)
MTGAEAMPRRRRMPSWLPQVLCYSLSAVCLIFVLHGYRFDQLIPAIKDLDWKWVAIAIAADLSIYVIHAWRWNTLLSPVARLKLWRTVQAIYIGLFANEVLPLRVGELIRCYLLAHWNGLRLSLGFSSAALERLIDGFWMLTAFLLTLHFVAGTPGGQSIPKDLDILVELIGVLLLAGAILLVWILRHKQESHAVLAERRASATLRHILEGLHLMGNPRTLATTAVISLLYLATHMFSLYALLKAFKTDYSFWVAAGAVTIIRFATVVPNAPGNLGVINLATVTAFRVFELPENDAKTFSIILFGAWTLPLLIGGAVATALTGVNIGELRDRAKLGANAESPEAS